MRGAASALRLQQHMRQPGSTHSTHIYEPPEVCLCNARLRCLHPISKVKKPNRVNSQAVTQSPHSAALAALSSQ